MASELTELSSQVGGHPDSMFVGDDKRILLKYIPPISQELGNYEFFQSNCKDYLPFLPHFFGTQKHGEKLYLKMENLVANYTFPCALDVKMGTKPFAPDASEEKKRIQSQKSLSTTGATLGLRIVGMKV
ncbi:putative inositol-hexakisphosphate 5-kinase [Monocercomonoides exilis]|uniref:putative inositol-hexakisphosphate 5-kinase n=1 Tax=Monocercomonoides exilis TaxID=2049356 RepID=UPI00355943D3|nr:putative inositol-hexakisphosphate 5-kinase [Monocercomonoides exilis]|eukprot:MONOS_2189.1-p1 / transcript=MONOS_2189.1 / gene=MONOS_2189 / organism=Monocercomonoides_exilis_PA203 / gene_product=unspecified product / transcript_product=unspecified product / location=Mono_scaffold00043:116518-116904(-) / protein_length=128 / sequence_SO=supercontig / SO=protein_coding / is_pseudo=false